MAIDLRQYSKYLEMLYTDRMDITSTEEIEDEDGATINGYPDTPQQVDIPCRISLSSKDDPSEVGELYAKTKLNPTVICSTDVSIRAGDRVTVRRLFADGTIFETFTGLLAETGKPNKWSTHQEFELVLSGEA